jgi:hypothetical protein
MIVCFSWIWTQKLRTGAAGREVSIFVENSYAMGKFTKTMISKFPSRPIIYCGICVKRRNW